ncbi:MULTISPECIES: YhcN/YlaJ family sporulation lipoprotein [Sporosarcina]|uniref:YhcN/YlaJ family sporulation lipoprotein n=1 Tax=Sporosarcina TaxID=1569 RepID=UPI0018916E00|nr:MULTISPECIES: YhcN/YlaJ family sporulation lipoprotein [Sporosarcina]GKV66004.1 hypothetical protein NCCP2331_21570 [Sporosarcina sp. NCCP-2331]GLB56570.1 hypothetical protein NCCP2378_23570 [Sporosarcina sp. NCCP-2378]
MKRINLLLIVLILLAGCSELGTKVENNTDYQKEQLEKILKADDHVKLAVALIHEKEIIAGIRVNTFSRFQKKKIAADLKKKIEKAYPDLNVTVSADSKVLLETEKLMDKKEKDQYGKKIKEIKSIVKEQT